jgi:hypothetical protein
MPDRARSAQMQRREIYDGARSRSRQRMVPKFLSLRKNVRLVDVCSNYKKPMLWAPLHDIIIVGDKIDESKSFTVAARHDVEKRPYGNCGRCGMRPFREPARPKAAFVTRLRSGQLPNGSTAVQTYRHLSGWIVAPLVIPFRATLRNPHPCPSASIMRDLLDPRRRGRIRYVPSIPQEREPIPNQQNWYRKVIQRIDARDWLHRDG